MDEKERLVALETEVKTELKSIKLDIHTLFKKTDEMNQMATAIALLTSSVNDLKTTVNTLNTKLDNTNTKVNDVAEAPIQEKAKNWNSIISYIIAGVIGFAFGYIGMKLGINK